MRWLKVKTDSEDGAVAVAVASLMVILLGVIAVVIDVGAIYLEKAQLQNGADSAALAIAQSCIHGETECIDGSSEGSLLAEHMADLNATDGASAVRHWDQTNQVVTVETMTETHSGGNQIPHLFGAVLGYESTQITAKAEVTWGGIYTGNAGLGLAFAQCEFETDTDEPQALYVQGSVTTPCDGFTNSSGQNLPGGFGWLTTSNETCTPTVSVMDDVVFGSPGADVSQVCKAALQELQNQVAWLPVYGWKGGTGDSGKYEVVSWAGFELLAYRFPSLNWPSTGNPLKKNGIYGRFVEFREKPPGFTFGPTSAYGTAVFSLTK